MEKLTKLLLMTLSVAITSCTFEEKVFVASGYSAENQADVKLFKITSEGVPEILSEFTCGENPSFFTAGRQGLYYFVNEVDSFNNKPGGGITTLRLDSRTTTFTKEGSMNQGGGGPCHVFLTDDNKYLLTANYGSGSLSVVALNDFGIPEKVTDKLQFGAKSHPHMVIFNPVRQVYYMSDLGLNRIYIFKSEIIDGILLGDETTYIQMEEGSGPRHMVVDKAFRNLYVINELSSTVSVIDITAKVPVLKQTISTLPEGYSEKNYCADLHLSASGKFLYGSNRGHNSIVVFSVARIGELTLSGHFPCGGDWPRNFAVNGSGKTLAVANQRSGLISLFSIEKGGKALDADSHSTPFNAPACIKFIK
jgi:6-phosphogluconolactonase